MIHQYKLNGYNIVLDVYSGSVHAVDELAYAAIALVDAGHPRAEAADLLAKKYADHPEVTAEDINDCFDDIEELKADGKLFAEDIYADHAFDFKNRSKIENLDGTTETVDFRFSTAIRFYHNMEDADFPLHWHAPGEIISPIEGTYTVTIAGKTVTLQPHDVLIIASGELHSIRAPKTGERYIMNYSVSYFHQIQDMAELFNTFYPFRLVTRQEDPELADQLFAVLAQIEGEYFSTNVCRESEIMALMLHFFSIFGRYEHRQNSEQVLDYPKQQDHMRRFAELCAYINNHCTERLSVEDLASRAGFSVYHFSRLKAVHQSLLIFW